MKGGVRISKFIELDLYIRYVIQCVLSVQHNNLQAHCVARTNIQIRRMKMSLRAYIVYKRIIIIEAV